MPRHSAKLTPLIWALTTGEAGMRTQARALAMAAGGEVQEKIVGLPALCSRLPAGTPGLLRLLHPASDRLAPPWPDLIVSCGRRSAIVARAVRRAAGGRPRLAHVQDPRAGLREFDLVVAMRHDEVEGPNVIKTATALHEITPQRLGAARTAWESRFGALPRPLTAVMLGGPTSRSRFGLAEARRLGERLAALRRATGGGAIIVPSRRTPAEVVALFLAEAAGDTGLWAWDRAGDNPYLGALALADRLVVTGDSVSMVSEALATPSPVEVFAEGLRPRHMGFHAKLVAEGQVRLFDGQAVAASPRTPIDATAEAAAAVWRMMATRS